MQRQGAALCEEQLCLGVGGGEVEVAAEDLDAPLLPVEVARPAAGARRARQVGDDAVGGLLCTLSQPQQLVDPLRARPLPLGCARRAPTALLERMLAEVAADQLVEMGEGQRV